MASRRPSRLPYLFAAVAFSLTLASAAFAPAIAGATPGGTTHTAPGQAASGSNGVNHNDTPPAGNSSCSNSPGTSSTCSTPQPSSNADSNNTGANSTSSTNPYRSTRNGAPSDNGSGNGQATGRPCAGCVGKADNKNPPGQASSGPSDHNNGYECDGNNGIGQTNPAHTGCTSPPQTTSGGGCTTGATNTCGGGGTCSPTDTNNCTTPGSDCTPTDANHGCTPPGSDCTPTDTNHHCTTPGSDCTPTDANHHCTNPGSDCTPTDANHRCTTPGSDCTPIAAGSGNDTCSSGTTVDGTSCTVGTPGCTPPACSVSATNGTMSPLGCSTTSVLALDGSRVPTGVLATSMLPSAAGQGAPGATVAGVQAATPTLVAAAGGSKTLPFTGIDVETLLLLAAGLAMAGGGITALARRRQSPVA